MDEILLVSPPLRVPCCQPWSLHSVNSCLHQRGAKNELAERQDSQWLFSREVKPTCQQIGGKMRQDEIWAGAACMPRFSSLSHFLWPRGNSLYHSLPHTARPSPVQDVRLQHMAYKMINEVLPRHKALGTPLL